MSVFRAGLVAALWLAAASVQAATVVVFGDSISAAYGLEVSQGWVAKLQQKAGARHHVINASVSGETSSGGLQRLPAILQQHQPQVVVLELGGNDGLRGQPPRLLENNLRAMITLATQHKARVLLLGMRLPPNYGRSYTEAFAAVYPRVAQAAKVPLVPFLLEGVAGHEALMQADGIHPNATAQQQLLNTVWPSLQPLLH